MKSWKLRIKTAWDVLRGRKCLLTAATQQVIYVSEGRPGRIVQLTYYRDDILALDNEGNIWLIKTLYGSSDFQIKLLMESPRLRR